MAPRVAGIAAAVLVAAIGMWWAVGGRQRLVAPAGRGSASPALAGMSALPEVGPARPATLERGLTGLKSAEQARSRAHWDADYVANRLGPDPQALLGWVRRSTYWVPYRGILRGAPGVLMDRQGNSLDRALLLSALLTASAQPNRIAHAQLPRDQAEQLLPLLAARRHRLEPVDQGPTIDPGDEIRHVVGGFDLDADALAHSIQVHAKSMQSTLELLDTRTAGQSAQLLALLGRRSRGTGRRERWNSAVEALRDHWWVQVQSGSDWMDLDPDVPKATGRAALTAAEATLAPEAFDSTLRHRIAVRLVAERWSGSALRETVVLAHTIQLSDSIGRSLELRILPAQWPSRLGRTRAEFTGAFRAAALGQTAWRATLLAGGTPISDVVLHESGETTNAGAGGPMGGLGQGIAEAFGSGRDAGTLTAAWIEYEIRAPGAPAETIRRALFDLVGDAARVTSPEHLPVLNEAARLRRSLALFRSTEILPLSSALVPEFILHLTSEGILRNRSLLRARAVETLGKGRDPSSVPAPGPLPSRLHLLALARFESKHTADSYLARPNILTRHTFVEATPAGLRVREATDIVANEVAVELGEEDAFQAQLRQGVRDTNAEALLPADGAGFDAVAKAFMDPKGWVLVDSGGSAVSTQLPKDDIVRIGSETQAGFLVVAPPKPMHVADHDFVGWWRIDPRTGHTLGVAANGWGQTLTERAAIAFVATFWFEYLICEGLFVWNQGQRTQQALAPPFPLSLATPLAAQEQEPCSIDALVSAFVAAGIEIAAVTWPLVLRTIAGRGYSGILSDRPWVASGDADPGDLPPIFNRPGASPPDPDCPPAAGPEAPAPAQRSSSEPGASESPPPASTGEGQGSAEPKPQEPSPSTGESDALPAYAADGSGMKPVAPEQVERNISRAAARRDALEQEYDEALIAWKQAANEYDKASRAARQADWRDEQLQQNSPGSDEANKAYEDYLAAQREAGAKAQALNEAERLLKRVEYALEGARYGTAWLNRLAAANRKAYDAGIARDKAVDAWQRTGATDYDSPEYAQFRDANERYRQAQRELSDARWDKSSPPSGTDKTEPALTNPSIPPTQPPPSPGGSGEGSPGGPSPAGACGGSPASPAAQSVGGVAAVGAGVGVGL